MTTKKTKPKPESELCLTPHKPTSWKNPIYNPDFCDAIQPIYATGGTDVKAAGHLGVARETFYEWMYRYPEFKKAVLHGKNQSHIYWAELGQAGAQDERKVDSKIWHLFMRNAHGWDKDASSATPATAEQVDQMGAKMDELMKRFERDV